jgi:hypothetical protein
MIIPVATATAQNSAYRHRNMKGAFGNEGALRFYNSIGIACLNTDGQFQATEGLSFDFLCSSGRTFSTKASAVIPCFLRRIGTAPCSMN